ncbi:MAG: hypothetical protein Ct9H300mP15_11960 [Gemmatimonadota bacterium]|nr:MAG: hypothetical protein Ct9H300mP15_11960 [Gemmatimonadota bacterium]
MPCKGIVLLRARQWGVIGVAPAQSRWLSDEVASKLASAGGIRLAWRRRIFLGVSRGF